MIKKYFARIILSVFSVFGFWYLESGFMIKNGDELIKSIIFGTTFFVALNSIYRKNLFLVCFFLFCCMVIFYLLWQMVWADRLASLGFGILLITCFSYFFELTEKGFVEKL